MTALGISKRQEFYNQERRHWRGADAAFYIPWSWKKTSVCDKMFKTVLEEKYELYRKRERVF